MQQCPIERVALTDKQPLWYEQEPGFQRWTWLLSEIIDGRPHHIPNVVWHHMVQSTWLTETDTHAALSAAARDWARAVAGLEPWPK